MKRCPECWRDYTDDTLNFCLEDGMPLVYGVSADEPATAILSGLEAIVTKTPQSESPTRVQVNTNAPNSVLSSALLGAVNRSGTPLQKRYLLSLALALLLITGAYFAYKNFKSAGGPQIESIAVMPFANESGNAEIEYLSDGMTETLINSLSQLPNLKVMSRNSVFRYKGKESDTQKVGSELNVRALITGSVKQIGDQLIINISLDDTQDNHHIWGEQYNRKQSDLISLQSEIARDVSNKLKTKLSGTDERRVTKVYTANPEAYQLYLQALYYWNKRTPEDLRRSIVLFQQAADKDSSYAQAYAGLALAYDVLPKNSNMPKQDIRDMQLKERAALTKARELDDSLAEVHAILARLKEEIDWDFVGSEMEFKRAVELNPSFATAHQWYSDLLMETGRREEAIAEIDKAHDIDPFSRVINATIGLRFYEARRFDEAISQLKRVIEMEPNYPLAHSFLADMYRSNGMYLEAIAETRLADALYGESPENSERKAAAFTQALQAGGAQGYWRKSLELNMKEYEKGYGSAYDVADNDAALSDKDRAFEWLEKSFANHEEELVNLIVNPAYDGLSSDSRFADLVRRVGLRQ